MQNIKVFLVDDNFVARRGLRSVLESEESITISGEASGGLEAIKRLRECRADVILMDVRMSGIDGIETTARILSENPEAIVLIMTVIEDPTVHMQAMMAGARGYMVYGYFAPDSLVKSIREVAGGQLVNIPALPQNAEAGYSATGLNALTQREYEILRLIAEGKDNREIALSLNIEGKTVKNHINSIYSKIGLNNRQEAVYYMLNRIFKGNNTPVK